ncbi:hypothetical protein ACHQM5_002939 [Ranunculus cassubicifolius]
MSVFYYIDAVTAIADSLALAGQAVPDEQLVTIIMNNIGPKFEVTVASAQARDTPIGFYDLVALLLSAKQRFNASASMSDSMIESPRTALYAPKQSSHYPRGRGSFSRGNSRGGRGSSNHVHGPSRDSTQKPSQSSDKPRSQCQICDRMGHTAIDCYNLMNMAYEGRVPTKKLTAMAASPSFNNGDATWYTDSGASNHITTDLANLAIQKEYKGNDEVAVGNGSGPQVGEDAY